MRTGPVLLTSAALLLSLAAVGGCTSSSTPPPESGAAGTTAPSSTSVATSTIDLPGGWAESTFPIPAGASATHHLVSGSDREVQIAITQTSQWTNSSILAFYASVLPGLGYERTNGDQSYLGNHIQVELEAGTGTGFGVLLLRDAAPSATSTTTSSSTTAPVPQQPGQYTMPAGWPITTFPLPDGAVGAPVVSSNPTATVGVSLTPASDDQGKQYFAELQTKLAAQGYQVTVTGPAILSYSGHGVHGQIADGPAQVLIAINRG